MVGLVVLFVTALALGREDVASLLQELEARPERRTLAAEPIRHAKDALGRARSAQNAGDQHHAALLRGLAEEWAMVGRDLVRTAKAEKDASEREALANEIETKLVRARSLLEETIARRGRAAAKLEELDANGDAKADPKPGNAR
jgi:hypothetical protein